MICRCLPDRGIALPDTLPAPGKPARREHEYDRNGTQCLFAALQVHHGKVSGVPSKTRNRWDLIRFLDQLDAELPIIEGQKAEDHRRF